MVRKRHKRRLFRLRRRFMIYRILTAERKAAKECMIAAAIYAFAAGTVAGFGFAAVVFL